MKTVGKPGNSIAKIMKEVLIHQILGLYFSIYTSKQKE